MLYYLMLKVTKSGNTSQAHGLALAPRFESLADLAHGLASLDLSTAQELEGAGLVVVTVKPGQPRPQPVALS